METLAVLKLLTGEKKKADICNENGIDMNPLKSTKETYLSINNVPHIQRSCHIGSYKKPALLYISFDGNSDIYRKETPTDHVSNQWYKHLGKKYYQFYSEIFEKRAEACYMLQMWSTGNVVPSHPGGPGSNPGR